MVIAIGIGVFFLGCIVLSFPLSIFPNGNAIITFSILYLSSVVSVCTYLILDELKKINNNSKKG